MLRRLINLWLARNAEPSEAALAAVADLKPITVVTVIGTAITALGVSLVVRAAKPKPEPTPPI